MITNTPQIVIAGASGYVGRSLIDQLLKKFPGAVITALSRTQQNSNDPRISWRPCDLFSSESLEATLPAKIDLAIYLVHSMGPTARLDQGSFADYDLILADNFARVLKKRNISQLIYLGGLIPQNTELSLHLQSRLEVEETFRNYKLPITIFRAGLILGENGSSFQILLKLVRRLPVMICPKWTQTLTTPVDLDTVISSIAEASLDRSHVDQIYDVAGCKPITYIEMMKQTAKKIGLRRYFVPVVFFTPTLSRLWVSLITNSSKDLVYPLVESLEHAMVARPDHAFKKTKVERTYFELLDQITLESKAVRKVFQFKVQRKTVRSVQRMILPPGKDGMWAKNEYIDWLPRFFAPIINVAINGEFVAFTIFSKKLKLLEFRLNSQLSDNDRQLLYVSGGLLVAGNDRGFLEFRVVLNRKYFLTAIHEYTPALPWYIYKFTQARLHLFVMNAYTRHLFKIASAGAAKGDIKNT